MTGRYTSNEVVALTGITPRQLQWWDEQRIVVPEREGHRRLYSFDAVAEIAIINQLRERGFSLQKIRKVMRVLQREMGGKLAQVAQRRSEWHLLTDGKTIFLEDSAHRIVDALRNARQPMLAICVSDAVREVHAELKGKRPARATPAKRRKAASA